MNADKICLYAVGDVAPAFVGPKPLFELVAPTLRQADILFGNLEMPVCGKHEIQLYNYDGRRISPAKLPELTEAGFHVMSFANNHTLDSGEQGLFETIDSVPKHNIAIVGAGRNIDEARKPAILERKGTKVAFLGYCSVLPKRYEATADKCGCAPMRASTFYEQVDWQPGTAPKIVTLANKDDLTAMVEDIKKVRQLADIVVMSIHWGVHLTPGVIAMYQREVGHAAIDAGADLILGHHAHILKGIEFYKGKPIFYSLANFVMQSRKNMSATKMRDPTYVHFGFPEDSRKTMIAKCVISRKRIEAISFLPVVINKDIQPEAMRRQDPGFGDVLSYMKQVTESQGLNARYSVEGDEVMVSERQ